MTVWQQPFDLSVNQFKIYAIAVKRWLQGFSRLYDGNTLNVVLATPDRAFAALQRLHKKRLGPRASKVKLLPYPIAAVWSTDCRFDQERFHGFRKLLRGIELSEDKSVGRSLYWPLPFDIDYQIEIEARNRDTMDMLRQWLAFETAREKMLRIDFSPVWEKIGQKLISLEMPVLGDNSDLQPEDQNRRLRLTATATLRAHIHTPPLETKTVLRIVQRAYLAHTGTDLDVTGAAIESNPDLYPLASTITYDSGGAH